MPIDSSVCVLSIAVLELLSEPNAAAQADEKKAPSQNPGTMTGIISRSLD